MFQQPKSSSTHQQGTSITASLSGGNATSSIAPAKTHQELATLIKGSSKMQQIIASKPIINLRQDGNKYLTHGAPCEKFTADVNGSKVNKLGNKPDAPAWFGYKNTPFSIQAGIRRRVAGTDGKKKFPDSVWIHKYEIKEGASLKLKEFESMADLRAAMGDSAEPFILKRNDKPTAALLEAVLGNAFDGYSLRADAVRKEPEIILFASGIEKISNHHSRKWQAITTDNKSLYISKADCAKEHPRMYGLDLTAEKPFKAFGSYRRPNASVGYEHFKPVALAIPDNASS